MRYPGAGEVKAILLERRSEGRRGFALLGDASKAHRRVAVRPEDWGLQACRLRPGYIWLNKVGTYGVGSAGYFWSRLAGAFHRLGFYFVGGVSDFEALLFADDWMSVAGDKQELDNVVGVIFAMLLLGFPWNWKKFRGGDRVAWIGYEIDYWRFTIGISAKRAKWLSTWVEKH